VGSGDNGSENMVKKGIFFTMIAIMISTLMITSFVIYNEYTLTNRASMIEIRINTMNNFIEDVDDDIKRSVFTSGFRAIFSITSFASLNASYYDDVKAVFYEAFLNGTMNGTPLSLMENSEFSLWIIKVQNIAEELNIDLNITVNDVTIQHSSPFMLLVRLNASFSVVDKKQTASWNYDRIVEAELPILGFQDPVYVIEPGGAGVVNTIEISNFTSFVNKDNNTYNLSYQANTSEYTPWTAAPTFLMRLEGNLSASPDGFGIESFVNLVQLQNLELTTKNKTVVDYIYFSTNNPPKWQVDGMPPWFRLDNLSNGTMTHHQKYNVTGLT